MCYLTAGSVWYVGLDLGDVSAAGSNYDLSPTVFRNGAPDPAVAVDQSPVGRPGLFVLTVYLPGDWLPGDTVQVLLSSRWEDGSQPAAWSPPVRLVGVAAAAMLGS